MNSIETVRSKKVRIPRGVYVLGAAIFVLGTTEFVIAGLLPEVAADFAVSIPKAGLLISAFAIAMVVGAPLLTVLTLRWPRRATLLGALGLFVVGQAVGALAGDYLTLIVARVITATATGGFWAVAGVVVVGMVDAKHRARALSLLMGGLTVANVLGVPLGTLVGQQLGWRATFWIIGVAAALAALAVRAVLPSGRPDGARPVSVRAELRTFDNGRLWLNLATIAVFESAVMGTFSYLAPVVTDVAGLTAGMVPVALTLYGVGSLLGIQIGGRLSDKRPWATMYSALAAIVVVLGSLGAAAAVPAVTMVASFVLGIVVFSAATPLNARVFVLAGPAPTLAGAAATSAFNVGNTVGPWLGGLVISVGWGFRAPALIGAALAAAALALGLVSRALDTRAGRAPESVAAERPG